MIIDSIIGLPALRIVDIFDIAIVAVLVYYIYRMARGTNVMLIFWALLILLVSWRIARRNSTKACGNDSSSGVTTCRKTPT